MYNFYGNLYDCLGTYDNGIAFDPKEKNGECTLCRLVEERTDRNEKDAKYGVISYVCSECKLFNDAYLGDADYQVGVCTDKCALFRIGIRCLKDCGPFLAEPVEDEAG